MTYYPSDKWILRRGDSSLLVDKRAVVLAVLLAAVNGRY